MNGNDTKTALPKPHTVHTTCGSEITVGHLCLEGLAHNGGRVTLDVGLRPFDHGEAWISLTPGEARELATGLLTQAAGMESAARPAGEEPAVPNRVEVTHLYGDSYAIGVRGHTLLADQPVAQGGGDTAATPTELFVASLASCVAFYTGRFLTRRGLARDDLRVTAEFDMAADRPARVAAVRLRLSVPGLPEDKRPALLAVASHCTVHNSLRQPPEVSVDIL